MKKIFTALCSVAVLIACDGTVNNKINNNTMNTPSFEELYRQVDSAKIRSYLSSLVTHEDHTVITAGTDSAFNSMTASWEVMGHYFEKPTTFSLLGAKRYTLEFILERQTYTLSFFPPDFIADVMAFGTRSGRDSDKMATTKLTAISTPSGNITYKEANAVIECKLFEITTVHPNDFYDEAGRKFIEDALNGANDYHKLVFGTITNVWIKR